MINDLHNCYKFGVVFFLHPDHVPLFFINKFIWSSYVHAPSHSLNDLNANLKVEITKEGIKIRSLTCNISKVERCVGALGWGIGRVTSGSIIFMNLHKSNNKLVNVWLEHFWCTNKSRAYTNSQDSPQPILVRSHRLPPYSILCTWPWACTQMSFCFETLKLKILKILKL